MGKKNDKVFQNGVLVIITPKFYSIKLIVYKLDECVTSHYKVFLHNFRKIHYCRTFKRRITVCIV